MSGEVLAIYITGFITLCTCFAQAVGPLAVIGYPLPPAIPTWHAHVILRPCHGVSAHLKLGYSLFPWGWPSKFSLDEGKLANIPSGKHTLTHVLFLFLMPRTFAGFGRT